MANLLGEHRDAQTGQIPECGVVEGRSTRRIVLFARRDKDHHALARTGKENAVSVPKIAPAILFVQPAPPVSAEDTFVTFFPSSQCLDPLAWKLDAVHRHVSFSLPVPALGLGTD